MRLGFEPSHAPLSPGLTHRFRVIGLVPALAAMALACGDDRTALEATVDATESQTFSPQTVSIEVNGQVTWEFHSLGHNVTFDGAVAGAPLDIGGVNVDVEISRTFNTAGTFAYHCSIHPTMTGEVIVQEAAAMGTGY